jgi:antitoxin (DNA-binding transcriptional repressor) of toxin-antitoxin stability system
VGYVLPPSIQVVDTPAEVRINVGEVKSGERVEITKRTRNWAQILTADGLSGWVEAKDLLDSQTYEGGQKLLRGLLAFPAQAEGHTSAEVNLRLEPSRDAAQLAQLPGSLKVQIFGRRLVDRPESTDQPAAPKIRDAWYLIRAEARAGWVMGRFVTLDIPGALSPYAQESNLVAWVVLNTVDDGGQPMPQYLAADRVGSQDVDFSHIRVFTYWVKNHKYVTAYVESNLKGYFPIRVDDIDGVPHFRLRLMDDQGGKYQKVYGLFDTITRAVGTVPGWESDAMPASPQSHHHKHSARPKG